MSDFDWPKTTDDRETKINKMRSLFFKIDVFIKLSQKNQKPFKDKLLLEKSFFLSVFNEVKKIIWCSNDVVSFYQLTRNNSFFVKELSKNLERILNQEQIFTLKNTDAMNLPKITKENQKFQFIYNL